MGLKADFSPHRALLPEHKRAIPRDKDGAVRLTNRLDGLSSQDAIKIAKGEKS